MRPLVGPHATRDLAGPVLAADNGGVAVVCAARLGRVAGVTSWLASASLWAVAAKAALMYLAALFGLRVAHRRTMAQWTAIDFAAAVAVGAIVGRTAVASTESLLVGVVGLATILVVHGAATYARFSHHFRPLTDHRVRVLVQNGELVRKNLIRAGMPEEDLFSELRQRGFFALDDLRYVLYESKGGLAVVGRAPLPSEAPLLDRALAEAPLAERGTDEERKMPPPAEPGE